MKGKPNRRSTLFITLFGLPLLALAAVLAFSTPITAEQYAGEFNDITLDSGLATSHRAQSLYWSVGQAWGDYNGDGWQDFYVTNHKGENHLMTNNQDGTFSASPFFDQVGLKTTPSAGAVFVDYDNDGDQDLYVNNAPVTEKDTTATEPPVWTVLQEGPNKLYRNDGAVGFVDVTDTAGVGDTGKGSSASWGDINEDGYLDLYVANWRRDSCQDILLDESDPCMLDRDVLYLNNGDGTFTDISEALGYENLEGLGFIASFLDFDNDGDMDIYLVNDAYRNPIGNKLFRNDGTGAGTNAGGFAPAISCEGSAGGFCFTEVATELGADLKPCGMGLAVGDYDNDNDLDLYFSNGTPCPADGKHHLLKSQISQGSAEFIVETDAAGVGSMAIGWATLFIDYDNDGWQDIYAAQSGPFDSDNGVFANNLLYHNNADGTFTEAAGSGADFWGPTWGAAKADFNRDGWVDLLITNRNSKNIEAGVDRFGHLLFENMGATTRAGNNWITIKLVGSPANNVNLDAVGARITLTDSNGLTQMQEVKNGSTLGGGNELALHFGMGDATPTSVTVLWPDGSTATSSMISTKSFYKWTYGSANPVPDGAPSSIELTELNSAETASLLPLVIIALTLFGATAISLRRRQTNS